MAIVHPGRAVVLALLVRGGEGAGSGQLLGVGRLFAGPAAPAAGSVVQGRDGREDARRLGDTPSRGATFAARYRAHLRGGARRSPAMTTAVALRRRVAWILILIVDVGFIGWGMGAAVFLDRLLGPGGKTILPAGYEGFTRESWA